MNRKPTPQSRGANTLEKKHLSWIKQRCICAACGAPGPVIAHHAIGSAGKVKHNLITILIGHAFVLGLCQSCDNLVTRGSRKTLTDAYGLQSVMWLKQYADSPVRFDQETVDAIAGSKA